MTALYTGKASVLGIAAGPPPFESKSEVLLVALLLQMLILGPWVSKVSEFCPCSDGTYAGFSALLSWS